jgi:hypothetical protein
VTSDERQLNLADYIEAVEEDRQAVAQENKRRRGRRAFLVFATDPDRAGQDDYKLVFACEAKTQAQAEAKVRREVGRERRIAAYLASGKYKDQLPEARWVA